MRYILVLCCCVVLAGCGLKSLNPFAKKAADEPEPVAAEKTTTLTPENLPSPDQLAQKFDDINLRYPSEYDDETINRVLPGRWIYDVVEKVANGKLIIKGETTYREDGYLHFSGQMILDLGGLGQLGYFIACAGNWKAENGYIVERLESLDATQDKLNSSSLLTHREFNIRPYIPIGATEQLQIIHLAEHNLTVNHPFFQAPLNAVRISGSGGRIDPLGL